MSLVADPRQAPAAKGVRHIVPARGLELRENGVGTPVFGGYVVRWDDEAEIFDWLGSFTERFVPGAFKKTVSERGPNGNGQIKFFRQHGFETSIIAARFLSLLEDDIGLKFEAETIDTAVGKDLAAELRSGVVDTLSFGFDAIREIWDAEEESRTVLEARLWEVSAVNWPAYPNSKINSVRALDRLPAYMDQLLQELRSGRVLTAENSQRLTEARDLLNQALNSVPSEPGDDPLDNDRAHAIAIAERKLALTKGAA